MEYKNNDYEDKEGLNRDDIPDYEDDDNVGCIGCLPLVYSFLLTITAASALYAAQYFSNPPQSTQQPSRLEQKLTTESNSKTLAEKCQNNLQIR
jgi:hypothetical protein